MRLIHIHPSDNVAVALQPIAKGETLTVDGITVTASEDITRGHKIALTDIAEGGEIIKYGNCIAIAKAPITKGSWVHTHNVRTGLSENADYYYDHKVYDLPNPAPRTFMGYRRKDGRAAIRNELWIIPIVGCVNGIAKQLVEQNQHLVKGSIDGLYSFGHPFGCSQLGDDLAQTKKLLTALVRHPNAGGVLCLGLGCENLVLDMFKEALGEYDPDRVKFLICQEVEDELEAGSELLAQLAEYAGQFHREELPASELVIGMKCGGSDGLSGITANPVVGRFSDLLVADGGTTVLCEVPEMFGAEVALMNRAKDEAIFKKTVDLINNFKEYFTANHQTIYENPSPGNKAGGISTLEDKSNGCVQKSGSAMVSDVLEYGERLTSNGLNLLSTPGNDLVAATAEAAAGCQMVLFTTGRGTPFATAVPTVKIATNSRLANNKKNWIDLNAGRAIEDSSIEEVGEELYDLVIATANGKKCRSEEAGYHDIAIFKQGVTL